MTEQWNKKNNKNLQTHKCQTVQYERMTGALWGVFRSEMSELYIKFPRLLTFNKLIYCMLYSSDFWNWQDSKKQAIMSTTSQKATWKKKKPYLIFTWILSKTNVCNSSCDRAMGHHSHRAVFTLTMFTGIPV